MHKFYTCRWTNSYKLYTPVTTVQLVTGTQVQLPAPTKNQTQETDTREKEKRLIHILDTWGMGNSCHKAPLHMLVQAEDFYQKGEGKQNKEIGGRVGKFSTCRPAQSILIGISSDGLLCIILVFIILVLRLKVSNFPRAGMPWRSESVFSKVNS